MAFTLLNPHGVVAAKESVLMGNVVGLMVIVAIAVFALLFFFAWRYRASNTKAAYMPNWEHGFLSEFVWWAIPLEIILVLGAVTWSSTHELDPQKALAAGQTPLAIEVVALPWKWLFIYPDQNLAIVNELELPVGRDIAFSITADAPMNSFWIPALGGQIYAMSGMSTPLHLMAATAGTYMGGSANYSGEGFAAMSFKVHAISPSDFDAWVIHVHDLQNPLSMSTYEELSKPGEVAMPITYSSVPDHLYDSILSQFMPPMDTMDM